MSPDGGLATFLARRPVASRAAAWAAAAHAGQQRQVDGAPFMVHPYEVAMLLHSSGFGDEVLAVFAADKVVKARELRLAAAADRLLAREVACKRAHYTASLEMLERRLPGHPLTDALRFELAAHLVVPALAWLRPAAGPVAVTS